MNSLGGSGGIRNSSSNMGSSLRGSGASGDTIPKGYRTGQLQNFTPEQMQLFKQMFSHVGADSNLSRLAGGDESLFNEMEAPAWRDFQSAQGQLASRFSGQGLGGRQSSAFQNASGQLGSDFAMNLQSQRQNLKTQALRDLMGISESLLGQKPYDRYLYEKPEKEKSFLQKLGGGVLRAGGTATGAYFGGPAGAKAGYAGGNALAEGFGF